jgi:carboxyl-terminal processing protease
MSCPEIETRGPRARPPRRLRWIVTASAAGLALLTVTYTLAWPQEMYGNLALLTEVLTNIQKDYVAEVDSPRLVHDAIVGMLTHLDGDNEVIDRTHVSDDRAGSADVGLVVTRRGDELTVVTSADGSSGRQAGLESGDRIEKIDGVDTRLIENAEAIDRLRGRTGSTVTLTVSRRGWVEPRELKLTRARFSGPMLSSRDLGDGVLLVRVHRMTAGIGKALTRELAGARHAGLVLDLRDVAGGGGSDAVELAQPLLDPGMEVAHAAGRQAGARQELRTSTATARLEVPTVVLVNSGTAGAAEIVAGALRDWQRAVLVGEQTFGAANVVESFQLSNGSVVRLTIARYFTPKGKAIDHAGIAPDFAVASAAGPASQDVQLERAVDVLKIERVIETRALDAG